MRKVLTEDSRFHQVGVDHWDWDQTYTAAEYRKLMVSFSGIQMMDLSERLGLLDDVEAFINNEFGGRITRPLVATLTTARLSRDAASAT